MDWPTGLPVSLSYEVPRSSSIQTISDLSSRCGCRIVSFRVLVNRGIPAATPKYIPCTLAALAHAIYPLTLLLAAAAKDPIYTYDDHGNYTTYIRQPDPGALHTDPHSTFIQESQLTPGLCQRCPWPSFTSSCSPLVLLFHERQGKATLQPLPSAIQKCHPTEIETETSKPSTPTRRVRRA